MNILCTVASVTMKNMRKHAIFEIKQLSRSIRVSCMCLYYNSGYVVLHTDREYRCVSINVQLNLFKPLLPRNSCPHFLVLSI